MTARRLTMRQGLPLHVPRSGWIHSRVHYIEEHLRNPDVCADMTQFGSRQIVKAMHD